MKTDTTPALRAANKIRLAIIAADNPLTETEIAQIIADTMDCSALLAALDALLDHEGERQVNGIGIEFDSDALALAKEQAREAIAKAEGRS